MHGKAVASSARLVLIGIRDNSEIKSMQTHTSQKSPLFNCRWCLGGYSAETWESIAKPLPCTASCPSKASFQPRLFYQIEIKCVEEKEDCRPKLQEWQLDATASASVIRMADESMVSRT